MNDPRQSENSPLPSPDAAVESSSTSPHPARSVLVKAIFLLIVFTVGSVGGYLLGSQVGHVIHPDPASQVSASGKTLIDQLNPPQGFAIPVVLGELGPQLLAAGAIDLARFVDLYQGSGRPLDADQLQLLQQGTQQGLIFTAQNAAFLLNFFWALGLTNQNDILVSGPMMSSGTDQLVRFASVGGWTLGTKNPAELYASQHLITLTDLQQARLVEVASTIYRPCCDNPTYFPDCNHGMAMLGLLELMASQDASTAALFDAAKYASAYWYPQQILEVATAFTELNKGDFSHADARSLVSRQFSSLSGFQTVHQWLSQNGLLPQVPNSAGSCGVE